MPDLLSTRQLNRATLARQFLLERVDTPAYDIIEFLVGLQAQERRDPYVGLWSRIEGFDPLELENLILDRQVVRLVVQRGTVHAVTADDCLALRPLAQPILTQQLYNHRDHRPNLDGVDLGPPMDYARDVLAEQPRNARRLREAFAAKFPEHDAAALTFACRNLLPFIQVPPRGLWSRTGEVVGTTAEAWLGRPIEPNPSVDDVMMRYVAAFGPASVQDAATWSRYTGLREVFDRLRPRLRTFTDDNGREYFDAPDGPLADPETPAPVRLLPLFDNVLLSHADRSRFIGAEARAMTSIWYAQYGFVGHLLLDGMLAGTWRIDEPKRTKQPSADATAMTVTCLGSLPPGTYPDVADGAERLLALVAPNRPTELQIATVT